MRRLRQWQINLKSVAPDQRSRDIFSYPIFSYFAGGTRRHISGHIRTYLNELQLPRWNYFFRPNLRLINVIDKDRLAAFSIELSNIKNETRILDQVPPLLERLRNAKARDETLVKTATTCGIAAAVFLLLGLIYAWPITLLALGAMVASIWAIGARRPSDIQTVEKAMHLASSSLGYSVEGMHDLGERRRDRQNRAMIIESEIAAIFRFRNDIAAQRPELGYSAKDIDAFLDDALKRLETRERDRLNVYADDEIRKFGPIVRWGFETNRKQTFNALKPQVNSIARRESHYVRYEVQFFFVHRGQLTIYEGFYDLIQGEMMGETRKHVVLGNIFTIQDEVSEDFDFNSRVQEAISYGEQAGEEMRSEGDEEDSAIRLNDDRLSRVSITQTRTVRLIGNGPPVELRFMVSDERDMWIAQLKQDRQREEEEIANLETAIQQANTDEDESESFQLLNAHEERLLRIREFEERVRRSETARDVERIITQILEFARHASGKQQGHQV